MTNPKNKGVTAPPQKAVWPVIHYVSEKLALENAAMAERCGCSGVFLIAMDGRDSLLGPACELVKAKYPKLSVGGNFLTLGPLEALNRSLELGLDATWTDRPGVSSFGPNHEALEIAEILARHPQHKFFGSVAFKYQAPEKFPAQAARAAANLGMIATTSGAATGQAVEVPKLKLMKDALGEKPLGLASGISAENAHQFLAYVDYFLVSTHISESPTSPKFSEAKLKALMAVVGPQASKR